MKTDLILKFIQNLFFKVIWSSTFNVNKWYSYFTYFPGEGALKYNSVHMRDQNFSETPAPKQVFTPW